MNCYTVYYRIHGNKKAKALKRTFSSHTKNDAKLMAMGVLEKKYTIIKIVKEDW